MKFKRDWKVETCFLIYYKIKNIDILLFFFGDSRYNWIVKE